ncbi:lipopolysaccharide biosynthesis protein [Pontibacter arcticus]|uniref:Lipopolysaccharide biosynthesis protein n=1 Tax=Pontibacter arcticus TaxID=2080288 RepID=A0A364RDP8_9BACT|nr:lipopolysaccharide biosynthesis protein [Pontibacter arcticus]RAU82413.1 lipopolysaccharide biosynthesis protein [Pontibacter arcticus]
MEVPHLKTKIISGIFWNITQLAVNKMFAFIIKLVLARLLFPEEFGLVGMAVVFTTFIQVFNDLGLGGALVQRKDEDLREAHYHTAFWTGIAWSVVIYLIITFIVAPLAAMFYGEPLLRSVIPVLSIGVLASPINLVHRAQLTKQMNFKKLAFINNAPVIFSGVVSITLAFMGFGVWSLVFNSVAAFVVAMPLYFMATHWMPKFIWEKEAFNDIFGFGMFTTGSSVVNVVVANIDYLLIGKLLSAAALGKYTLAFVLTDTFRNKMTTMINRVMYPVYGKKQGNPKALRNFYFKVVKYNSICIYPVMLFLIILGEPFVINVFGEKWIEAVGPLKILAFSVMIHILVNSHAILIRGLGKARLEMRIQFLKAALYVPTIAAGIYFYGTEGAAWAYVFNKVLEVIIAQYYLKKLVDITPLDLFMTMRPPLLASIVTFAITYMLYVLGLHYILCTLVLGITFGAIIWLSMKAELLENITSIKNMRKKVSPVA